MLAAASARQEKIMLATIRMLSRYNAWANRMMFAALSELPEGEALKPRPTLFGNMVHTLNHNYVIGRIFQAHLEGRSHGYSARNTEKPPPLEELRLAQAGLDRWYIDTADAMSAAACRERLAFVFVGGGDGVMTRGEMLLHVVNHTSYHRGFVADMFCQVPARPPAGDLTVFLRDVPRDWIDS